MATQKSEGPRCSFCSKTQLDVLKLIAGPAAFICDECVGVCNDLIAEKKTSPLGEAPALEIFASRHFGPMVRCRLCQTLYTKEQCLAFPDRGWLCGGCVDAVRLHVNTAKERLR
jgi:hypothetical protein